MVPYMKPEQGKELPNSGTALGDECSVCGKRFTIIYYVGNRRYCGQHMPTHTPEAK